MDFFFKLCLPDLSGGKIMQKMCKSQQNQDYDKIAKIKIIVKQKNLHILHQKMKTLQKQQPNRKIYTFFTKKIMKSGSRHITCLPFYPWIKKDGKNLTFFIYQDQIRGKENTDCPVSLCLREGKPQLSLCLRKGKPQLSLCLREGKP